MRKKLAALGAVTAAAALAATLSGPAQAAEAAQAQARGCSTEGASGIMIMTNWTNPNSNIHIEGELSDLNNDSQHARIRLLTKGWDGDVRHWRWHKKGGGGARSFETTAEDDTNGIFDAGVQVARFSDDGTMLNSCVDW